MVLLVSQDEDEEEGGGKRSMEDPPEDERPRKRQRTEMKDRSNPDKIRRKGVPSAAELWPLFNCPLLAQEYLIARGVLKIPICKNCRRECKRRQDTINIYRCCSFAWVHHWSGTRLVKKRCNFVRSIFRFTIFEKSRLPLNYLLMLCHCWAVNMSVHTAAVVTGITFARVSAWYKSLRCLVTVVISETDNRIGGPGKVVQIDKSKFGKRKKAGNGRGHQVEGAWVFGGVEQYAGAFGNNKYFCTVVQDRRAETLIPLITR